LLIARYLEESKAGLNTGLIRAVANSGKVVTTAGLVFAVTMMAMLSSDLLPVGQMGSILGLGLLLDTLIVRSFIAPAIACLLNPFLWWPRIIRSRPARTECDDRSRASLRVSVRRVLDYLAMTMSPRWGWWGAWKIKSAKSRSSGAPTT
jgi:putative drug exporter of the RND superfamily